MKAPNKQLESPLRGWDNSYAVAPQHGRWGAHQHGNFMNAGTLSGPGISIPPPVIYVAALIVGVVLNFIWPLSPFSNISRYVIGLVLILVSLLIMPPVLRRFRRASTSFDVRKAASALITDGPYRFSRNPAYVSLTLLYLGIGVLLNNGWSLVLVVPIFLVMDLWVVRREERHLEAKFGEEYLHYKAAVRRWL